MKIRNGFVSNSSTSSFVLSKFINLEATKRLLINLVTLYNLFQDKDYSYEDIFEEPRYINEEQMGELWGLDEWSWDYWKKREDDKYIEIRGIDDNSVPGVMYEWITDSFEGRRYHLG